MVAIVIAEKKKKVSNAAKQGCSAESWRQQDSEGMQVETAKGFLQRCFQKTLTPNAQQCNAFQN